jgi:hypothetical protein
MYARKLMYTIKHGNKTIGLPHKNKHFIIGFDNQTIAKKVQYAMHPEPEITLISSYTIDLAPALSAMGIKNTSLVLDVGATLYVPKHPECSMAPKHDRELYIGYDDYLDFLAYPLTRYVGVVLPYDLIDEDKNKFVFRSHVIEPSLSALLLE